MKCSSCGNTELKLLVVGIWQCPKCMKIIKEKKEDKTTITKEIVFESGEFFMKNTGLNKKYEICENGVVVFKTPKKMLAVLICYSPNLPNNKYVRLSWFKNSVYLHAGMIKITEPAELNNIIIALEKFNEDFDEDYNKITKQKNQGEKIQSQNSKVNNDDIKFVFEFKDKKCPKCSYKMKKSENKKYFSCEACGEIVVLEDGIPIFDIATDKLPLSYSSNFPVNYYIPEIGITFKWLMGEWKALVIIYDKSNPDKKFLRFYWWTRNLQDYISGPFSISSNLSSSFGWSAKKGVASPNIYEKKHIKPVVRALKKIKRELNW